jgi:hypothetical protein
MEDHEAIPVEAPEQAGGAPLPCGPALPGARLLRGAEPQPPADQRGHRQPDQPSLRQAGLGGEHVDGEAGGGDQRRSPGQAAGPDGQFLGAAPPVGGQGGAAGAAKPAGDLGRHRWRRRGRRGRGTPAAVLRWVEGGPAAAQQLGGLIGVDVQEPLELLGGQGADRQAGALVDRRAQFLQSLQVLLVLLVRVRLGVGVLAHVLLPSAS